ncbi:aspartyl-phosphate phosphatase Spo0E family protein [Paenibacillus cremeus]|uniref:Aspartyl-phosphate phosphatase Spo0E family protein n=2 Tax=Paenibacillus cremeus TaxID=2163881 RepID=A0A559K908_9BACL|nr:aspartyl-phosphate phosphatase Spo0E family protein [Paenibacillus cremeus]
MMESFLQEKIESLRFQMIELALIYGTLTHEQVVMVSQQLDRYLVVYQKIQYRRFKMKRCC